MRRRSLSGAQEWAEVAVKPQARVNDDDEALEFLNDFGILAQSSMMVWYRRRSEINTWNCVGLDIC